MADRKTYFQAMAFIFTALLYGALHMSRTAWAYSKDSVLANNPYYKKEMLGIIDTCFLSFYAGGLYLSGWLGDRVKLRWTIGFGALLAMIGFCGFGYLEGVLQINSLVITCFLFIINGLGQSTGWPGCIAVMGNWFSAAQRGLIIGIWGGNINVGNIMGQQLGRIIIDNNRENWDVLVFYFGGITTIIVLLMWVFMKESPKEAGIIENKSISDISLSESSNQMTLVKEEAPEVKISFFEAWKLPGVFKYAIIYMNCKSIIYALLLWLPLYLKDLGFHDETANILPAFDVGTLIGATVVGHISDKMKNRSLPLDISIYVSGFVFLYMYTFQSTSYYYSFIIFLFVSGWAMGGAASLIGGVIASDLGETKELKGNNKAISTVSGIIEGSGTIAAAGIQMLVPIFKNYAFLFYGGLALIAAIFLTPTAVKEYKHARFRRVIEDTESQFESPVQV